MIPDILCIAKGMGGGMPIGCFISSTRMMKKFTSNPILGHITTFGGHPVNCTASLKTLEILLSTNIINEVSKKENLFRKFLKHTEIESIDGVGLMLGLKFKTSKMCNLVVNNCRKRGLLAFYFLFEKKSMRISPPLTITEREIRKSCDIIIKSIDKSLESLS